MTFKRLNKLVNFNLSGNIRMVAYVWTPMFIRDYDCFLKKYKYKSFFSSPLRRRVLPSSSGGRNAVI